MSLIVQHSETICGLEPKINGEICTGEISSLHKAFLSNISHEIKTPANAIIGFVNLLDNYHCSSSDKLEFYRIIQQSTFSLIHTIDNLVEMSKVQVGMVEFCLCEFSVADFMEELYAGVVYAPVLVDNKISFSVELPTEDIIIKTDRQILKCIVRNLLDNALKFTNEGCIFFQGRDTKDGEIEIVISDTGIGTSLFDQTATFSPFTKGDTNSITLYSGLGIGLFLCQYYCDLLGGELHLQSQKGIGTIARIVLPLC